jgi:hypothetical protein
MSFMDWFKAASPTTAAADVAAGAATGLLTGIGSAANSIREAITGKLSADDQAKFDLAWQELTQKLQEGQQAINLADAQSGSNFRGGWRPAIGWMCALALGSYYIPQSIMATVLWTVQCFAVMVAAADIGKVVLPAFPIIFDINEILGLVASLLGLATLRTYDLKTGTRR